MCCEKIENWLTNKKLMSKNNNRDLDIGKGDNPKCLTLNSGNVIDLKKKDL